MRCRTGANVHKVHKSTNSCKQTAEQMRQECDPFDIDTKHQCALTITADCIKTASGLSPFEEYK